MTDETVERVARAWASMDGKPFDDPEYTEGYLSDAQELLKRAALDAMPAVGVNPLEWEDLETYCSVAQSPLFGRIRVESYGDLWDCVYSVPGYSNTFVEGKFNTREEAKAAAQADYERRIRSTLTRTPDPVAEAARVLLEDTTIADKDAMNRAGCEALYLTGFMPSDLAHFDRGRIAALRALTKGGE